MSVSLVNYLFKLKNQKEEFQPVQGSFDYPVSGASSSSSSQKEPRIQITHVVLPRLTNILPQSAQAIELQLQDQESKTLLANLKTTIEALQNKYIIQEKESALTALTRLTSGNLQLTDKGKLPPKQLCSL